MTPFGSLPPSSAIEFVEEAFPQHQNSPIARAEMLLGPIRDSALPGPCDEVLIHDVARQPSPVAGSLIGPCQEGIGPCS